MNNWVFPFSEKTISDSTLCEAVLASVLSEGVKTNVSLDSTSPFSHLTGELYTITYIPDKKLS